MKLSIFILSLGLHLSGIVILGYNFQNNSSIEALNLVEKKTASKNITYVKFIEETKAISSISNKVAQTKQKPSKQTEAVMQEAIFNAEYLNNTPPSYPYSAKKSKLQGTVLLKVTVNQNGLAEIVEIAKSSGYEVLDASAKKAVSKWRFVPAKVNGLNAVSKIIIPIEFKLI